MTTNREVRRYSDEALAEFQVIVEQKLQNALEQLQKLQSQILEINENTADDYGGDWVDDSSVNNEMEMLNNMAIRQRKYVQDLQNALLRIKNKTYGICVITGELIDHRRLLAVPTTTKSLEAKSSLYKQNEEKQTTVRLNDTPYVRGQEALKAKEPRVISRIIRKPSSPGGKVTQPGLPLDLEDDEFGLPGDLDPADLDLNLDLNLDEFQLEEEE